ncbi:hypothetical protein AMTR_s00096p00082750 [Amborella trichopoda]|uniref:Uncharacterized protein n=1 Tax=Amborella trichopoda TaxID=13333 RepID=W1P379_AMBTC|nr:hypothetical protein AMTR_s00096p00082750 [Amborella trichopoda]
MTTDLVFGSGMVLSRRKVSLKNNNNKWGKDKRKHIPTRALASRKLSKNVPTRPNIGRPHVKQPLELLSRQRAKHLKTGYWTKVKLVLPPHLVSANDRTSHASLETPPLPKLTLCANEQTSRTMGIGRWKDYTD